MGNWNVYGLFQYITLEYREKPTLLEFGHSPSVAHWDASNDPNESCTPENSNHYVSIKNNQWLILHLEKLKVFVIRNEVSQVCIN